MHRFVAALLLFLSTAAFAQAPVEIKLKLPKGQSWKVELSAEVAGTGGKMEAVAGQGRALVRDAWSVKEAWTDVSDADVEGRPTALKRSWTSAKVSAVGKGGEAAGQEGATVRIEAKDKEPGCTVAVTKGKLPTPVEDMLVKFPLEPATLLLPAAAVKLNDEWKIPRAVVCDFHRSMCIGLLGGLFISNLDGLIKDMKAGGESGHGCEVTAKVTEVTKTDVTITFEGAADDGAIKMGIKGTLKWNVSKGRPAELAWTVSRIAKANDEMGTKGWTEDWKLAKSWK